MTQVRCENNNDTDANHFFLIMKFLNLISI